ncbi:MAG: hypothetical protein M3R38_01855 [Actinomycetota bacterium]|nr:hypothetical protein [Actinomycetota bacterium]
MPSYLSGADASARIAARFGLTGFAIPDGYAEMASDEVDGAGPFVGQTYAEPQALAFPRTYRAPRDAAGVVPEAVLDYVALRAAQLSQPSPSAPIQSHSVGDVSRTYASPKRERLDVLVSQARRGFAKYRRKTGVLA